MTTQFRYRIHPAIGIARVGNAPASEYFLGPELPNQRVERAPDTGTAVPPFKSDGLVKRQAARFRVFEYVQDGNLWTVSREVSLADEDVTELTWTVYLANRKASFFDFQGLDGSPEGNPNTKRRNVGDEARLEIDPLPRSIGGRSAGPVAMNKGTSGTPAQERWPHPPPEPAITSLGELRTDQAGRLIVVPGAGTVGSQDGAEILNYANNPGWFDDVGDGPVTATLKLRAPDGTVTEHDVEGAWLLAGPPDFAPPLPQPVSLYDVLLDLAVQHLPIPADEADQTGESARLSGLAGLVRDLRDGTALSTYTVSFDRDVAPILRAAFGVSSVFEPAHQGLRTMGGVGLTPKLWEQLSDPDSKGLRGRIFTRVRPPAGFGTPTDSQDMPHLRGDDPYNKQRPDHHAFTLTPTQYAILRKWAHDEFIGSALGPESLLDPPQAQEVTAHGLDRAATECASGGAFFPGIEVGWLIRQPWVFAAPFRIKHGVPSRYRGDSKEADTTVGAGFFSRQMALPWLADFLQCMHEDVVSDDGQGHQVTSSWGWWPSQRPDSVTGPAGEPVPWHRCSGPDGVPKPWPEAGTGRPNSDRDQNTPSYGEMLLNWYKFGFIMPIGEGKFGETERADHVPDPVE
jgi:hypothetical protein